MYSILLKYHKSGVFIWNVILFSPLGPGAPFGPCKPCIPLGPIEQVENA